MMKYFGKLEIYWLSLMAITLFNAALGEGFDSTLLVSLIIAGATMYKGLVVIDHFMELKGAHKLLRLMMRAYFYIFPSLIIITLVVPDMLRRLTTLG
jgi:hypothetical protein